MNQRRIVAVLLAFLLLLAGGALTAAQSDDPSKVIPGWLAIGYNCNLSGIWVAWDSPEKAPDSYRLSWTHGKKWRSYKKPNTSEAGNLFVPGNVDYKAGSGVGFSLLKGRTLRARIRAIYKGEKNGPWRHFTYSFC